MVPIVHALSLLQNAVTARRITHFQPSTACVISCVRSVLSATDCLGRDSPFLANFPALASARKHVLSELAKLVTQARKVSEGKMTIMEANRLDDEMAAMLNMGDAVFGKVRKFLAVAVECGVELPERRSMSPSPVSVEDDAYSYDRAVADVTPTLTSSYSPPDVYSDRRLSSQQQPKSGARTKSLGDLKGGGGSARPSLDQSEPYAEDSDAAGDSSLGHTPARPKHRRRHKAPAFPPSSNGDSTEYAYAEPIAHQRGTKLSISSNDSFSSSHGSSDFAASSPGFPSGPTSTPQVLITLRATQDRLLSIIAAFIGHVHSYSNYSHASSKGHLIELTKETVDQVRHLLALVDSVISTPEILEVKSRELIVLEAAKATLFSQTSSLVDSIRSITSHPSLENEDQEKGTCLQAATGAIRAGAECVTAVQRCLSRRIGEEPFTVTVVPPPSPDSIPQGYSGPTTPPSQSTHGLRKNTLSYLGRKTATLRSGQSPGDDTPDVDEETELDIATQDETVRVRPQMDDQDEYRIHGGPRLGPLASSREASSRGSESTNGSNLSLLRSDTGTLASSMEDPKIGSAIALGRSFMEGTRTSGEEESASEHSLGRSSEEKSPENLSSLKKKIIYGTLPSVPSPTEFKSDDPYAWLLTHDYDEKDIHFNAQGVMTGATLPVMVEKMTSHFYTPEPTFLSTFFLTFRLFTTPKEFVEAIIARYDVPPPPPTMPPDEVVMWQDKKVKVVRVRILNLLKTWIDSNWRSADSEAIPLLQEFITEKLASNTMFASPSRRLLDTLNKRQAQEQPLTPRSIDRIKSVDGLRSREGNYSSNTYSGGAPAGTPPTPVINKTLFSNLRSPSFANVSILDFDVLELARQLTIMESRLYCGISSDDMLDSARPGVRATESVKAATALSNAISGWVIESILNERDLKKRITLVKFFIKLADVSGLLSPLMISS
jgi:son of sevenless-like protein